MTQNIEHRTIEAVKQYENASGTIDKFAHADDVVHTPAGARKTFPKISKEWEENAKALTEDWKQERDALSIKALPVLPWVPNETESNLNQQRRFTDGHTYLPKTVPVLMNVEPDDNWLAYTASKSDVLSDVFGNAPVDLMAGMIITSIDNQYPKLAAFGGIYELADNSQAYTVKSFAQSVGGDCVITLDNDQPLIAKKVYMQSKVIHFAPTFANALSSKQPSSVEKISTLGHTLTGVGCADYVRTQKVGASLSGDEYEFFDGLGNGWILAGAAVVSNIELSKFGLVPQTEFTLGQHAIFERAFRYFNHLLIDISGTIALEKTLKFPRNTCSVSGISRAPFANVTEIIPINTNFNGACMIDLNERGKLGGGNFNILRNLNIHGGMKDFRDPNDEYVDLIGVRARDTVIECGLEGVSFRRCGIPFDITGWQHKCRDVVIYECHVGGNLISTHSSIIDGYTITTCYKNWGVLDNCLVKDAIFQQGNDLQTLADDIGVTCKHLVEFTGIFYTEGGTKQIYADVNSTVRIDNATLGFAQKNNGTFGNHNIHVSEGAKVFVRGESVATKSFIVGGDISKADTINLDIEPVSSRIFDDKYTAPNCSNMLIRRPWGVHKKEHHHNMMKYHPVLIDAGMEKIVFSPNDLRTGGVVKIVCTGINIRDVYECFFSDSLEQDPAAWMIDRKISSPGNAAGIVTKTSAAELLISAQGENVTAYIEVEAVGAIEMKNHDLKHQQASSHKE